MAILLFQRWLTFLYLQSAIKNAWLNRLSRIIITQLAKNQINKERIVQTNYLESVARLRDRKHVRINTTALELTCIQQLRTAYPQQTYKWASRKIVFSKNSLILRRLIDNEKCKTHLWEMLGEAVNKMA